MGHFGEYEVMSSKSFVGVLLSFAAASTVIAGPAAAQQLGSYDIRQDRIYVAGISSGGYMAVQMHVAFSRLFKGAAIYAGGPYDCAQDSLATALSTCESDSPPVNVAALESITASWASQGLIDPVDNLKGQPVYLWSGTADTIVQQPLMDAVKSYYQNFQASVFQYDNNFDAQHGWESPYGRLSCQELATPYLIQCANTDQIASTGVGGATGLPGLSLPGLSLPGLSLPGLSLPGLSQSGLSQSGLSQSGSQSGLSQFGLSQSGLSQSGLSQSGLSQSGLSQSGLSQSGLSQSGLSQSGLPQSGLSLPGLSFGPYDSEKVWLTQWFGNLNAKNEGTLKGAVIPFDQNEFAPGGKAAAISMDQTGYAFVPADCANGQQCGLILALHGCQQNFAAVGWDFIDDAGINEWADTNRIIVLYPQTVATNVSNPQGCWDWWGYLNDPNYAQKSGPQMQALSAMVTRVAGLGAQAQ
jgi:poly(3-hydroxybutyrate) depolymerase